MKTWIIIGTVITLLGSSGKGFEQVMLQTKVDDGGPCINKIDEYAPALLLNNIKYTKVYNSNNAHISKGKKIGDVKFKMNGMVCPGYLMKNGDATQAEKGTGIYQAKGYSESFRLFVGEDLYEVFKNPRAKTIGELFDIKGKVAYISMRSIEDHSQIGLFSDDATIRFTEEFLKLSVADFRKIYNEGKTEGEKYFFRLHLTDQSSLDISYWPEENVMTPGAYGNEEIKRIVLSQIQKLTSRH
ncbi:hypothetical protein [Brevibacillus panacihumi]|uniref:hypothetical protein n=1 Tax=Brevibacillus panacihumi TaxID=497735 RepID=UPI003D21DA3A